MPVDSSGVLAAGEKFSGPIELKAQLLRRKDDFAGNLTEKMLAYALGRGLEPYDLPTVRKITEALEKDNYRNGTLVAEIVKSYPFQYRRNGENAVAMKNKVRALLPGLVSLIHASVNGQAPLRGADAKCHRRRLGVVKPNLSLTRNSFGPEVQLAEG